LGQEQKMMCCSRGNRPEKCERGAIEKRLGHGLCE
jgi:hypothetical protein